MRGVLLQRSPRPALRSRLHLRLRSRRGVMLLEVIVAMTILVIAGLSAVVWVRQLAQSLDMANASAIEVRTASWYLDRIALWPREDLDRHLGERAEGAWRVRVDRPTPTIYLVTLRDTVTHHVVLQTALYRAEPVHVGD